MSLAALLPGALGGTPILDAATELPLGTIVLLTEASIDAVDLELIPRLRECSPWAPVVLLAAATANPNRGILRLLAGGGGGYVCVPDASSDGPSVIAIRNGVAARPSPGLELVGGYLQVRLGEHAALAITSAIQGDRGRTTRRHLQQLRLAPPHVWQALLPTVLAGVHALRHQCTRTQAAHQLGLRDVTIARHCRALTGRSWRDLLALTSWEAMMEAGVRCGARETVGSIDPDELV